MYNVYRRGLDLAYRDTGRRKRRQGNRLEEEKGKRDKAKATTYSFTSCWTHGKWITWRSACILIG
jgi:hypothetical protein